MLLSGGNLSIFWSNGLVGAIVTLALLMLFWPLISLALDTLRGRNSKPALAE
jgi:putative tricarboxylic transport membrane protein